MKRVSSVCMSLFLIVFLAIAGPGAAFAQQGTSTPEERAKQITDKMKTDIPLEESQYTKVYDINLKYMGKMKDIRQQTTDRKQKM